MLQDVFQLLKMTEKAVFDSDRVKEGQWKKIVNKLKNSIYITVYPFWVFVGVDLGSADFVLKYVLSVRVYSKFLIWMREARTHASCPLEPPFCERDLKNCLNIGTVGK